MVTAPNGSRAAPNPWDLLPRVPSMPLRAAGTDPGSPLPDRHAYEHGNRSPAAHWGDAPAGTGSLAVTMFDPDAPTGSGFWHWAIVDLPPDLVGLDEGRLPDAALVLRNDFGNHRYDGPMPPAGHGPHHYITVVHALDVARLGVGADTPVAQAGARLASSAIARGVVVHTYER